MSTDAGRTPMAAGMPVATQDGEALGTVKEVRAGYFKVDVRLKPDYWLQADFAHVAADGRVVTSFSKEELGAYKVAEPPARVVDAEMPLAAEATHPLERTAPDAVPPRDEDGPRARP